MARRSGDALIGQSGNQMMHISPRYVASRMSRTHRRSQRGVGEHRDRLSILGMDGGKERKGWARTRLESRVDSGRPTYLMVADEVESLRPDASLTMSIDALLASSSASRS